ncbi:colicin uptake protein TolQ [Rubripirellula obstinata]|uniref:Colicin uptake protein TolQ n=1 Tax=Rubripirellula obstinata TaxID=406547 RepID=A0A5B1CCK7_9BACT|nr:MotA/TolQ/ExbB proton channel family protein [Rubripirellula obstinata]KAA1258908.1 colicin uptake protein TolQ [Rubripirellula obstinata]
MKPLESPHRSESNRHSRRRTRRISIMPLATRMFALAVLCLGSLGLMMTMQSAQGQYQNNQFNPNQSFGNQGYGNSAQQNRSNFRVAQNPTQQSSQQSGIPSIPSAAQLTPDAAEPETEDSEQAGFEMPAIVQKITQGGWLMIPLGICSLIVLTLSFERMIALRRSRVIPRPFVRRFTECVEDGQLSYDEATEICEEFDCPVAEVFQAAVRRWGRPMFEVEQAVMDAGDRVADGLKRFLRVFHAISNVAPLLGLLGTVLGMIEAFEVISSQDSMGRPEMLASGISVALITTAGGLAVAIPAYLAYMYFSSKSDRYLGEIDKLCQKVVDCISAEGLENTGNRRQKKRAA